MAGKKKDKLTPRQRRFVLEYLIDMNATAAAARAGYSIRTSKQLGHRLLQSPAVQAELAKQMTAVSKRLEMSIDDVVREYVKIARANITDFLTFDNDKVTLGPSSERTPEQLAAVAEVRMHSTDSGSSVSLKLHSKTDALLALGKHLGMFVDRHEHKVEAAAQVRFYLPDNGRRPAK